MFTISGVILTNITLGMSGPSEPFKLSVTADTVGASRVLELTGQSNFTYVVEASTNLVTWESISVLVNTNGAVRFYDPDSPNHRQRFYRATVPSL